MYQFRATAIGFKVVGSSKEFRVYFRKMHNTKFSVFLLRSLSAHYFISSWFWLPREKKPTSSSLLFSLPLPYVVKISSAARLNLGSHSRNNSGFARLKQVLPCVNNCPAVMVTHHNRCYKRPELLEKSLKIYIQSTAKILLFNKKPERSSVENITRATATGCHWCHTSYCLQLSPFSIWTLSMKKHF